MAQALFATLLAFFWFDYLRPGEYFPVFYALKVGTLVPLVAFALTIGASGGRPNDEVLAAHSSKWFGLLLLILFLQFIFADVRQYVWETFTGVLGYMLVYYMIVRQVTSLARVRAVMASLILVHVVTVFLYPEGVMNPEVRAYLGGAPFFADGNDFGWSVAIVVPMALYLAYASPKRTLAIFFYGLAALLVLTVVATQSRGASLALLAIAMYIALKTGRKGRAVLVLGALAVLGLMFAPDAYFERMNTITTYEEDGSAQGRILAWKTAMRMAFEHPLLGVGAKHFSVAFGAQYKPDGYVGPYLNAHSIYFVTLGELGFSGLVFLVGLLVGNFRRNERLIEAAKASKDTVNMELLVSVQASFLAFLVGGAFLSGVFYPHIFVLSGLMEAVRDLAARGATVQPESAPPGAPPPLVRAVTNRPLPR